MKAKLLIDLYKEWMEAGEMPKVGLCNNIPKKYKAALRLFIPDKVPESESGVFWGYGQRRNHFDIVNMCHKFSRRRQAIVLLICAMHNEL